MSGHSKWHNIQATKSKNDAARGKIFTKLGREISVAAKLGGADINNNARLRDAVAKAKYNNMSNDTIDRTIKKAVGELGGADYESITYEGYGIGGSAVIVECLTDNKNRTAGDVRSTFDKYGGSLGVTNSVSFMFARKGVILTEKGMDEEMAFMQAIEAGAEDFEALDDAFCVTCAPTEMFAVKSALEGAGMKVLDSSLQYIPSNYVSLNDEQMKKFETMIEKLEDFDDVQNVFHNVEGWHFWKKVIYY